VELTTVANRTVLAPAAAAAAAADADSGSSPASRPAFALFLLLNATMFIRPAELVPQWAGLPIYEVIILLCLVLSLPLILEKLRPASLARNPITLFVLAMLPAIVLSLLIQGDTWEVRERAIEFTKTILYYLLLVSLVNSRSRLRAFLISFALFTVILNVIALLSYHGVVDLTTVEAYAEKQFQVDPDTGEQAVVVRLQAAGVYGNPNMLARIIAVGITICLLEFLHKGSLPLRMIWLAGVLVLGHAMQLTYSRGGLLGLIAGIVVLVHARFGAKKGGAAILVLLPVLVLFSGRQTDIDTDSGTGQLRIKLWSNGLVAMRSSPVFGIGAGRFARTAGNDAHNSFVEAFVETGLVGGTLFTSAFFVAAAGLYRCKSDVMKASNPELFRMRAYVLSIVVGYIVGQFSASRAYFPLTYTILGLATIYLNLAGRHVPVGIMRVTPRLLWRLLILGACTLLILHLYTKFNARFYGIARPRDGLPLFRTYC
jgi:O-antigen ligase